MNVLFLCTGNSARSIFAEALMNHLRIGAGRFRGFSAGSHPKGQVHPQVLDLLERHKVPTAGLRSKSWAEFAAADAPVMDVVITVCDDAAAEICPVWPGQPVAAHWGVPDPVAAVQRGDDPSKSFVDAFVTLRRRIELFTSLPFEKLNRLALARELDRIGRG
jgi:arsenate reductase